MRRRCWGFEKGKASRERERPESLPVRWVEQREAHAEPTSHYRVGLTSFDPPYL